MSEDRPVQETNEATNTNEPANPARRRFLAGAAAAGAAAGLAGVAAGFPGIGPLAGLGAGLPGAASAAAAQGEGDAPEKEFAGKVAFVTGGARGIGRATAESLARAGADVVLYDVAEQIDLVPYPLATTEDLAEAQAAVEALGVRSLAIQGDVRDGARLKEAANQAVSEFGSLDFMIANAGITQIGFLDQFSEEELDIVLDINLAGAMKTIQAAIPIMQGQNSGRIVLMSSITGRAGSQLFPVYSASKWGMIGIAKSTAQQMGPFNVTVNAVTPSLVHTGLLDNDYILGAMFPGVDPTPTFEQAFDAAAGGPGLHVLPVGAFGPEVVGDVIRFICSDAAGLISGDVFEIQGGANSNNLG